MRVIAVDWSGALSQAVQRRSIWLAVAENGRLLAMESGRSRDATVDRLLDLVTAHPTAMVALDFAFGFPSWFGRSLGCTTGQEVWDVVATDGERWLADGAPPFWGRPGSRRPLISADRPVWRRTETAIPAVSGIRPKSVFQIGGAGAVGTGSLRGMPSLRRMCAAGIAIWPFEAARWPVAVEAWPRLCTGPVVKSSGLARTAFLSRRYPGWENGFARHACQSEDAFDAAVTAVALSSSAADELQVPGPAGLTIDDVDRLEGRVWPEASTVPESVF